MRVPRTISRMIAVGAVLCFAPAAHATGWVTGPALSPADRIASDPQVAITPDGERVVAWRQQLTDANRTPENVSVRVAAPGGDFSQAQTFAGPADEPLLAAGPDGTVGLAWLDASTRRVHIARLDPGRMTFEQGTPLTVPGTETPSHLHVAVSSGDVVVSFESLLDRDSSIWAAHLPAGANTVALLPGAAAGGALDHQTFTAQQFPISVDESALAAGNGQLFVTWQQQNEGTTGVPSTTTVKLATLMPSGQFGPPTPVNTQQASFAPFAEPAVAAGGGHLYVAWLELTATDQILVFKDLSTGGPTQTIPTDSRFEDIQAAVDGSGSLTIAGQGTPSGTFNQAVSVATVAPGATPAPAVRLTPPGIARQLDSLAVAADGTALLLPDRVPNETNATLQVLGSFRGAGGSFGPPLDVSGLQDSPDTGLQNASGAVASGGRALAAWTASDPIDTPNARVHVSELDMTPPVINMLGVALSASVGQRVQFSAVAADALSPPVSLAWDFGDGSQATGASVAHVFAAPGPRTVTLTATDMAGNSASQTRVLVVNAATGVTDQTPPRITRLRLSPARFRVGNRSTAELASVRRAPTGTVLRLTLSERATVAVTIRRGRATRGMFVRASEHAGGVSISFSGRVGGTTLTPGRYTATVTAIDAAGNRSAPKSAAFMVVTR